MAVNQTDVYFNARTLDGLRTAAEGPKGSDREHSQDFRIDGDNLHDELDNSEYHIYIETEIESIWRNSHRFLQRTLLKWQLPYYRWWKCHQNDDISISMKCPLKQGAISMSRCSLISMVIPIIKIRRSRGCLFFIMAIHAPGKTVLYWYRIQVWNDRLHQRLMSNTEPTPNRFINTFWWIKGWGVDKMKHPSCW